MNIEEIDVSEEMQAFRDRMKKKGLKSTPQRDEFAKLIFQSHDHFTVDQLINTLKKKKKTVSHATAYRVVQMMSDLGLIVEHNFGRGTKYYEHIHGHSEHDHLICNDCGRIFDFFDEKLESKRNSIAQKMGFKVTSYSLTIFADCNQSYCKN